VKDIFDTYDMPTEYGSRIYAGHRPRADSAPVALARAAGGVILGKTVTCEFATFVPSRTRNPHNAGAYARRLLERVGRRGRGLHGAARLRHADVRLGDPPRLLLRRGGLQADLQPAAARGVHPNADSLDTIGVYARSVEDVAFFLEALTGRTDLQGRIDRPRIGACRTWEWELVEPPMASAFETAAKKLDAASFGFRSRGAICVRRRRPSSATRARVRSPTNTAASPILSTRRCAGAAKRATPRTRESARTRSPMRLAAGPR
jgi:amidase